MFGAHGDTKQEMLRGLKYPDGYSENEIAKNFKDFTEKVSKTNGLKIGNKYLLSMGVFQIIVFFYF